MQKTLRPIAFACCLLFATPAAKGGDPGSNFCTAAPNSTGVGSTLAGSGTADISRNDLVLRAEQLPPNRVGLFFYGAEEYSGPFGNGIRCVGAGGVGVFRLSPPLPTGSGTMEHAVDYGMQSAGAGQITAGITWYFQAWYRDPAAGGANFNLTDGYAISFNCGVGEGLYAGMQAIPGGSYLMGDHNGTGYSNERPLHEVELDAFYMDTHEVTLERFAGFLTCAQGRGEIEIDMVAGGVQQVGGAGEIICHITTTSSTSRLEWDATNASFGAVPGWEDHPVMEVSWYGAALFANNLSRAHGLTPCYDETSWECDHGASGYRLPTEAEWEYAARAGTTSMYPWGGLAAGQHANYSGSGDAFETQGPATTPVGYYNGNQQPSGVDMANGFGLYDMIGNVAELCGDWYEYDYYATSPTENPKGPTASGKRVIRGGDHTDEDAWYLRTAARGWAYPHYRYQAIGFRLVAAH
ncbi:MAG: SUMF1/EgtB/PvdO family nonheme iron enzyme [Planctomycetota bacterium]|nr:hypothetical protein [Planctomycetota bacterium]MDP6954471.1 SUMF1/EgtB/PvdO family nonheme iron enzyme [Planctomycetota bacterium]